MGTDEHGVPVHVEITERGQKIIAAQAGDVGMNRDDILAVATAYAGRDDWGVVSIYLSTLTHLLAQLEASIPVDSIIAHAGHMGRDCCPLWHLSLPEDTRDARA